MTWQAAPVFVIEAVRNMNAGAGHEDTPVKLLEMAMKPLTKARMSASGTAPTPSRAQRK